MEGIFCALINSLTRPFIISIPIEIMQNLLVWLMSLGDSKHVLVSQLCDNSAGQNIVIGLLACWGVAERYINRFLKPVSELSTLLPGEVFLKNIPMA